MMNTPTKPFDPREHLVQLKSRDGNKDYLPVQARLVWFREQCSQGSIETELVHLDLERETEAEVSVWNAEKRRSEKVLKHAKGIAIFKATIQDGKGGVATGFGSESASDFNDFLEKAETKAIGRALAALGYGTQFSPEMEEQHRIVDSPVERHAPATSTNGSTPSASIQERPADSPTLLSTEPDPQAKASEQQRESIRKLCQALDSKEPANLQSMTYAEAATCLKQFSAELRAKRAKAS